MLAKIWIFTICYPSPPFTQCWICFDTENFHRTQHWLWGERGLISAKIFAKILVPRLSKFFKKIERVSPQISQKIFCENCCFSNAKDCTKQYWYLQHILVTISFKNNSHYLLVQWNVKIKQKFELESPKTAENKQLLLKHCPGWMAESKGFSNEFAFTSV